MSLKERYLDALNSFTERVKNDPNVIALLLCGSLSYANVWEKSDIDLIMLVRDGSIATVTDFCLDESGVEINLYLKEISKFKKDFQKSLPGDMIHSTWGMGTLIFTKDEGLQTFFDDLRKVGKEDALLSFRIKIGGLLNYMAKAEKWITIYNNTLYSQRFLQICGAIVADMELLLHNESPTRESILRAQELNAELMNKIYVVPSTTLMSETEIRDTLKTLDNYLVSHIEWWSKPIIQFLNDGEVKTISHIWKHCGGAPMNYLAEKGIVEKTTQSSRLFKNTKLTIEEQAYFYIPKEEK